MVAIQHTAAIYGSYVFSIQLLYMVAIQHTATIHGSYSAFNIQYSVEHTSYQLEVCSTNIRFNLALVSFSLVFGAI